MTWKDNDFTHNRTLLGEKLYDDFKGREASRHLPGLCLKLLSEQKRTWPALRESYKSLKQIRQRGVVCKGFSVVLQYNPGRIKSTLAAAGQKNRNNRQCFLCVEHLPEHQKGILYRGEYLILCNPAPVFSSHFTISHLGHRPQSIHEQVSIMLQLATDFGPGWTVLYNGPRCGASAPDHLHFQAVPTGGMPIEKEILQENGLTRNREADRVVPYRLKGLGREVIILEGEALTAVGGAFTAYLDALKKVLAADEEPMINIAGLYVKDRGKGQGARVRERTDDRHSSLSGGPGTHQGGVWRLIVFPRRKHRPDAFFRTGDARIAVSPAVIEMGGVLVTPFETDFERLDAATVESIYGEVSLETESVESAIDAMAR